MTARDDGVTAPAILATDTGKRLDAIIRRHGGKPTADTRPSKVILPPVGKRTCKGQMPLIATVSDRLREAREGSAESADE